MSLKGVKLFAAILSDMQEARIQLLGGDIQDIQLGQLLEDAKNSVKDRFTQITLETPDAKEVNRG